MSISFRNLVVDIKATANHKIKTTKGWKQLKDLKTGGRVIHLEKEQFERQLFNGDVYYKYTGKDFSKEDFYTEMYHNGEIPEGYHVHHIDGDRYNNNIENLECLCGRLDASRKIVMRPRNAKKQENGLCKNMHQNGMVQKRVRHRHYEKSLGVREKTEFECEQCHSKYKGKSNSSAQTNVNQNGEEIQVLMS